MRNTAAVLSQLRSTQTNKQTSLNITNTGNLSTQRMIT